MILTEEQQKKVEENIGLVYKVMKDKIHVPMQQGVLMMDDLFQIGCLGLCKAVMTDKGGTFSTYAYRLIWNEICDALIYSTRRQAKEQLCDSIPEGREGTGNPELRSDFYMDLQHVVQSAEKSAPSSIVKGIRAMLLMALGYTSKEIGAKAGASDKLVCAWVSKARKFMREQPEL